jgi:hypothetical protein
MTPLLRLSTAFLLCGATSFSAWAVPVYKSADFSGGLFSVTSSMKTRLTGAGFNAAAFNCFNCANPTPVTGHVIFDSAVPVPGSGTVNVFSIGAIANVANAAIFELDIDGISLRFGDPGIQGGPFLQYKNGVYNGFAFAENFGSPNATALAFSLQGGAFSLNRVSDNALLFSGFLNIGASGLTNLQDFNPNGPGPGGVPEPGTLALLGAAALAGCARLRRQPG